MPGVIELSALIVSSLATTVVAANALYLGTLALVYGGLAYGATLLQGLLVQKPSVPKPEDGSYNLKQNVPSLAYVLGRVKKGGDYAFLEENAGIAYHIIVMAAHRIQGYVQHYLHDEKVTLDGSGVVTTPAHFAGGYVKILTRLGLGIETAYADIVTAFPTIWSNNHRGDGLASIRMSAVSASSKNYLSVYPNQMPLPSAVIDGALLYDPRSETTAYSRNLALMRLWHLCHPVGGKMSLDDMYLPDWANGADVCDETVINRDGETENRYHGGLWFRASNDPVEVGRIMDQAAELVVFERPDGLVGVHPGKYVEPDIRLVREDIISAQLDGNTRDASTVLAVRGRFTDQEADFNTADAAIYGNPYIEDDSERTKTVDNSAIQSHNHVQRIQKITYLRANAPRAAFLVHYEAAKNVPYRRFIKVHLPSKMNEAVIELTSTPKLSLKNMTIEFSGIIVSETLYDFDASTEEGVPPPSPDRIISTGVPGPTGFDVTINREVVYGGQYAAFAVATWTHVSDVLTYELEWEPTSGTETARQVMSNAGEDQVRSSYLSDGVEYKFRLRAWATGASSDFTTYQTRSVTADPTAPLALSSFILSDSAPHLGRASFGFSTVNDAHIGRVSLYRVPSGTLFDPATATLVKNFSVTPSASYTYVDGDPSITNLLSDSSFDTGTGWTFNTGWSRNAGTNRADHASAAEAGATQTFTFVSAVPYRYGLTVVAQSAAGTGVFARFGGGTAVSDSAFVGLGDHFGKMAPNSGNTSFAFRASTWVGSVDTAVLFQETVTCAPQGIWDYYALPRNGSGVPGPASGPVTVAID